MRIDLDFYCQHFNDPSNIDPDRVTFGSGILLTFYRYVIRVTKTGEPWFVNTFVGNRYEPTCDLTNKVYSGT